MARGPRLGGSVTFSSPLMLKRQDFGFTCVIGASKWYACGSGSMFVGCCRSEPCEKGCPQKDIEPASYNEKHYSEFPDANCTDGGLFYQCQNLTWSKIPPFLGCCKSNACNDGCAKADLTGAYLGSPNLVKIYGATPASISMSSALSGTTLTASISAANTLSNSLTESPPHPTSYAHPTITSKPHKAPVGAIAGAAVGGAIFSIIVVLIVYCLLRTRQRSKNKEPSGEAAEIEKSENQPDSGAPPQYASADPAYTQIPNHQEYRSSQYGRYELPATEAPLTARHSAPTASSYSPQISELSSDAPLRSSLGSPISPIGQSPSASNSAYPHERPDSYRAYQPTSLEPYN